MTGTTFGMNADADRLPNKTFGSNRTDLSVSTRAGSNASSRSGSPAPSTASVGLEDVALKLQSSTKDADYWAQQRLLTKTIMDFDEFMPELKQWREGDMGEISEDDSESDFGEEGDW